MTIVIYVLLVSFNSARESNLRIMEVDPKNAIILSTFAAEEKTENGKKFRWFVSPGDKLEFKNQTWVESSGLVELTFGLDPCNTTRDLILATPSGPIYFELTAKDPEVKKNVKFKINLKPEENVRFFLIDTGSKECKVSNGDTRSFIAKLENWNYTPD